MMKPDRDQRREQIVEEALSLDGAGQAALLDRTCAGDPGLRSEMERQLRLAEGKCTESTESMVGPATIGMVIGPYRLLQIAGQGGMGEVWLAEQKEPVRRRVALKLIKAGMDTREVIARFDSERQALALMDHPAIARVFEAGSTPEGKPYFSMEYVPGIAITDYCDKHKLTLRERVELFAHVCEGVQHAHQKAIIHRDLKPSNILVSEVDGRAMPKIIDFGVAKAMAQRLTDATMLTRLGTVIGTLEYMSPEQADSAGEDIDTRADVYSLGVILYEILVGALPLDCRKLAFGEVLRRIREEEAPRPSTKLRTLHEASALIAKNRRMEPETLGRQLRGDLDSITLKSIEKDRARRYGSPSELAADLQRYLRNEPVSAGPATVAYRARKFVSKHRWWMAVAAAFVAVLVAAVTVSTREAMRADRERDKAVAAGREANAQKLTAYAIASLSEDPERSIALAMHAVNATLQFHQGVQPAAVSALHSALIASRVRLTLHGHQDIVTTVVFSPDGRLLATSGWDETAKVWSAATGQELLTLRGHPGHLVRSVAFSPDGKRVVTGGADGIAKVWDAATGRELLALPGHAGPIFEVAFHPDGKRIATASLDRTALWDAEDGRELLTLGGPKSRAGCVGFSPDGKRLLTCNDQMVTIWNATNGRELLSLRGHQNQVLHAAFSPDGRRIVTAGVDMTAKLWDAESGLLLVTFRGHKSPVLWAAFSPDGQRVATSSTDQTVKLWDAANGQELLTLASGPGMVNCVAFSPDGSRLAAASSDNTVKLLDISRREEVLTLSGHQGVSAVAFSPDGERVATADGDRTAAIWDAHSGQELLRLRGHDAGLTSLSFSPDGKFLATASQDKTAKLWDSFSGHEILTLRGHQAALTCVSYSPDGRRLATASRDKTVKVWDAASGRELITLGGLENPVACAAFSPDGKRIAAASVDKKVVIWDALAGRVLLTWRADRLNEYLATFAFSPDGKRLAAAGGNTISIWSGSTGQELTTLHQGPSGVTLVRFSPDGRHIAAANADGTATLWDAAEGKETLHLRSGNMLLTSVAFSADGRRLATAELRGVVQVYALDIGDLLALARKRVTRPLTVSECRIYFQAETCPSLP